MHCATWYHLWYLKNVKNTHLCFSRFLNCTNGTKSRNASQFSVRLVNLFEVMRLNVEIFYAFEVRPGVTNTLVTRSSILHRKCIFLQKMKVPFSNTMSKYFVTVPKTYSSLGVRGDFLNTSKIEWITRIWLCLWWNHNLVLTIF